MLDSELLKIAGNIALKQIGLDIRSIGYLILENAIEKRMRHCGLNAANYGLRLESSSNEQNALCQLLLISESWFERESEPLALAINKLASKSGQIQVLSIPCARGEEPISILSMALEAGISLSNIKIDGYDASFSAIEQAKLFSFGEYSFRGSSEKLRSKHFSKHGPRFILNSNLRNVFLFEQANVLDKNWTPKRDKYDLIVCRNMLIYLEVSLQKQLLLMLERLLNDNGLLLLGAAEAALANLTGLESTEISTLIFKKKNENNYPKADQVKPDVISMQKGTLATMSRVNQKGISKEVNNNQTTESCTIKSATQNNFELANQGQLKQAFSNALEAIEQNPQDSCSYYLLGLISSSVGNVNEAKFWLSRALELNPENEEAEIFLNSLDKSEYRK